VATFIQRNDLYTKNTRWHHQRLSPSTYTFFFSPKLKYWFPQHFYAIILDDLFARNIGNFSFLEEFFSFLSLKFHRNSVFCNINVENYPFFL